MKLGLTTYLRCNKVGALNVGIAADCKSLDFLPVISPLGTASLGHSYPSGFFLSAKPIRARREASSTLFFDCGLRNRGKAVEPPQVRKKGIHDSGNTAILRKHGSQSVYENCGNRIPNPSRRPKKTQPPITVREQHITQQVSGAMRLVPANASVNRVTACHQHLVKCRKGVVLSVSSPSAVDS